MPDLLLVARELATQIRTPDGIVHVVNGVFFDLKEGELLDILKTDEAGILPRSPFFERPRKRNSSLKFQKRRWSESKLNGSAAFHICSSKKHEEI